MKAITLVETIIIGIPLCLFAIHIIVNAAAYFIG